MATITNAQQDVFSTTVASQEERETSLEKIRPELNLEKWSIFAPAHSKIKRARTITRITTLPDGSLRTSKVSVDATERLGTLTTEEQKTYYALIKIWEEKGKPKDHVPFSLRRVARTRGRKWGTRALNETVNEMRRLTGIPLEWSDSFFNQETGETVELLESFHILDNLKIALKKRGDKIANREVGYFKFNDFILKNLLSNYTKPLLLEVVLKFKTELALVLYTHLDLIMARRNHYERRTKELFDDLGIEGEIEYRYPSGRKRQLEKALQELKGARLTTGIITTATLEKTKDEKDYKLVIRKSERMPLPPAEHTHGVPESGGVVASQPQPEPTTTNDTPTTHAKDLVGYFHQRFHNIKTSTPSSKELTHATVLIARYGPDQARHIVDFSYQAAQETNYKPQSFGGILQYTSRALAAFEDAKRKEIEQTAIKEQQRRAQEEERLTRQYEDFRRERLDELRATTPTDTLTAIEQAAATQFEQDNPSHFGRNMLRRIAMDNALAAHFQFPSLEQWRATHNQGIVSTSLYPGNPHQPLAITDTYQHTPP